MMTAIMLFGLNLSPLFRAIAQVESDRGATSANIYQIRDIYIADVNRVAHTSYTPADKFSSALSENMMIAYWRHYGRQYSRCTGKPVTYEVLARLHNGGPTWFNKTSTYKYWMKISKYLKEEQ